MNIFELFGTIAINNKGANKGIDETSSKAKKLANVFGQVGQEAMKIGKTVAKGMAVVSAAGTAAVGLLLKNSIGNYAEYEQLVGGIETLFKDSQGTMLKYAKNAYKTAGLSANEYMATATSFAASLLQGLGGDTQAAATMTDMAIKDMADNANKMGTDISMIQNAYQGFAKQNYTMLDNLKLGYGGTASEMARLINDSGVMGKNFKATAKNVKDISFAKMIEAIHVIQKEMGIVDTTINEAKDTISGSFTMLKASWANLMTGLGDEENVEPLVDAFFEAGNTVLKNLAKVLPKIGNNIKAAMARAGIHIKQAWEQNIWPTIQKFTIKFGIELPDWGVVDSSLNSWWEGTGKPAIENIKVFFSDVAAFIANHKEEINGFLFALGGTLLILNAPLALLIGALALVAANWETIKNVVTNAIVAVEKFFTQEIPAAWESMVQDIGNWWSNNVEPPISRAIGLLRDFFDQPSFKEVVIRFTTIQGAGGDLSDAENNDPSTYDPTWREYLESGGLTENVHPPMVTYDEPIGPVIPNAKGAVFSKATIFDTRLGYQMVGEAGPEAVAPINVLQDYVSAAVRSEMSRMESGFSNMLNVLQIIAQNTGARQQLMLNKGLIAGEIAPYVDAQLGTLTARKERRG
jgi:hypothetical protein